MKKVFPIILICIGFLGGLLVYFMNTINSSITLYSPIGKTSAHNIILICLLLGIFIGVGSSMLIKEMKEEDKDDDDF